MDINRGNLGWHHHTFLIANMSKCVTRNQCDQKGERFICSIGIIAVLNNFVYASSETSRQSVAADEKKYIVI